MYYGVVVGENKANPPTFSGLTCSVVSIALTVAGYYSLAVSLLIILYY